MAIVSFVTYLKNPVLQPQERAPPVYNVRFGHWARISAPRAREEEKLFFPIYLSCYIWYIF